MEALGRWKKNNIFVMPDTFVPIMEKYGMIQKLDFQILEKALFFLQTALQKHKRVVPVSVNISRYYLSNRSLADQICQMVDRFGISHHLIKLEITETVEGDGQTRRGTTVPKPARLRPRPVVTAPPIIVPMATPALPTSTMLNHPRPHSSAFPIRMR